MIHTIPYKLREMPEEMLLNRHLAHEPCGKIARAVPACAHLGHPSELADPNTELKFEVVDPKPMS